MKSPIYLPRIIALRRTGLTVERGWLSTDRWAVESDLGAASLTGDHLTVAAEKRSQFLEGPDGFLCCLRRRLT